LAQIFDDLIRVYKLYSECISNSIKTPGVDHMLRPMKTVRKDILKLIQIYIEQENDFTYFNNNFLPILQSMIEDYMKSDPNGRDPETLHLFANIFKRYGTVNF